jgi:REP element-mobilizing transposase RayT
MPAPQDAGRAFVQWDRQLDKASRGPLWLRDPPIAKCVVDALHFGDDKLGLYRLLAWVVMPNHVHVLWLPFTSLPRITRSVKWFTARRANEILNRVGQPFWQDESYDHWVRDGQERERITRYIESNPVKAGLVAEPRRWHWSSAAARFDGRGGE